MIMTRLKGRSVVLVLLFDDVREGEMFLHFLNDQRNHVVMKIDDSPRFFLSNLSDSVLVCKQINKKKRRFDSIWIHWILLN